MAILQFIQKIDGFWDESTKNSIPPIPGVYFVYEAKSNFYSKYSLPHNLIYIGESENVHHRINNHEKRSEWHDKISSGNIILYSVSSVVNDHRNRIEAAYIHHHKPSLNTEYVNTFPFDLTRILSNGMTLLITTDFVVGRKNF